MSERITELVLPIKRKWFDMILAGEKTEEYREIKPYWTKRFKTFGLLDANGDENIYWDENGHAKLTNALVTFRNGYGKDAPEFKAWVYMKYIGFGREEWGAKPECPYYVIGIKSIVKG